LGSRDGSRRRTLRPRPLPSDNGVTGSRLLVRAAAACLIAGFGLLNLADAAWAHAVGVVCLFAFVLIAFRAIVSLALDEETAQPL